MLIVEAQNNKCYQTVIKNSLVLSIRYREKINSKVFICDAVTIDIFGGIRLAEEISSVQLSIKYDPLNQHFREIESIEFDSIWKDAYEIKKKSRKLFLELCDDQVKTVIDCPMIETEVPF